MEELQLLKDKLKITDFVCRGNGARVVDLVETYYLTLRASQNNLSKEIQSQIKSQGFTPEALSLFLGDEDLITNIVNNNSQIFENVDDSEMPDEYKKHVARIVELETKLNQDDKLSQEDRKVAENAIIEAKQALNQIKSGIAKQKIADDPSFLQNNPKMVKALIEIVNKETKIQKVDPDPDGVLYGIQTEIQDKFMLAKKEEHAMMDYEPPAKHLFSKMDFMNLLVGITQEKENFISEEAGSFFINTRSL
jgi:DNA-binding protein H-NS